MRTHLPVLLQQAEINPTHRVENDKVEELTRYVGNSQEDSLESLPLDLLCQLTTRTQMESLLQDSPLPWILKCNDTHATCCVQCLCQVSTFTLAKPHDSDKTLASCRALPWPLKNI